MPIYEYKCKRCGNLFDAFQAVGASSEHLNCPTCGEPKPERIFSAFGTGNIAPSSGSSSACSSSGPFS